MTNEQLERMAWLEHCLSDPDCGRLFSKAKCYQMAEELEHWKKIQAAEQRLENRRKRRE